MKQEQDRTTKPHITCFPSKGGSRRPNDTEPQNPKSPGGWWSGDGTDVVQGAGWRARPMEENRTVADDIACSHITLQPKTSCPLKLSRVEPGQYLDGRPPGKN